MQKISSLLFLLLIILLLTTAYAEIPDSDNRVKIYFFWGQGCPHCEKEKLFLEKLVQKYPQLEIESYEVWLNSENARFFALMSKAYGIKAMSVPTTFIGDFEPIVGYRTDEVTGRKIEEKLKYCIDNGCIDPIRVLERPAKKEKTYEEEVKTITLPLLGGNRPLKNGIACLNHNPCWLRQL